GPEGQGRAGWGGAEGRPGFPAASASFPAVFLLVEAAGNDEVACEFEVSRLDGCLLGQRVLPLVVDPAAAVGARLGDHVGDEIFAVDVLDAGPISAVQAAVGAVRGHGAGQVIDADVEVAVDEAALVHL